MRAPEAWKKCSLFIHKLDFSDSNIYLNYLLSYVYEYLLCIYIGHYFYKIGAFLCLSITPMKSKVPGGPDASPVQLNPSSEARVLSVR